MGYAISGFQCFKIKSILQFKYEHLSIFLKSLNSQKFWSKVLFLQQKDWSPLFHPIKFWSVVKNMIDNMTDSNFLEKSFSDDMRKRAPQLWDVFFFTKTLKLKPHLLHAQILFKPGMNVKF